MLPKTCRFEGCDGKAPTKAAMKKHEEDCEHRLIPCAFCDDKIGMQGLAEHLQKKHGRKQFTYRELPEVIRLNLRKNGIKDQNVLIPEGGNENQQFVCNFLTLNEVLSG